MLFSEDMGDGVKLIEKFPPNGNTWTDAETVFIPLSESLAVPSIIILPVVIVGGYDGYVILTEGGLVSFCCPNVTFVVV